MSDANQILAYAFLAIAQFAAAVALAVIAALQRRRARLAVLTLGLSVAFDGRATMNAARARFVYASMSVSQRRTSLVSSFVEPPREELLAVLNESLPRVERWPTSIGASGVTEGALLLLARAAQPEDVNLVCRALFSPRTELRPFAAMSFGRATESLIAGAVALPAAIRDYDASGLLTMTWALQRILAHSPDQVIRIAGDPSPLVRRTVVMYAGRLVERLLAEGRMDRAEPFMAVCRAAMNDLDVRVRATAAQALSAMPGEQSLALWTAALLDDSEHVQINAAEALAGSRSEEAVLALAERLPTASSRLRIHILNSLARARPSVPPRLLKWLKDDDLVRPLSAVACIGVLKPEAGIVEAVLNLAASGSEDMKREACHAIARIARSAPDLVRETGYFATLVSLVESENDGEALGTLAEALAATGDARAIEPLMKRINTTGRYAREKIVEALALISMVADASPEAKVDTKSAETIVRGRS